MYSSILYQFRCYNRAKEKRYILQTTTRRKANLIGHTLRRNCLLKQVIETTIEGKAISDGKTRNMTYTATE